MPEAPVSPRAPLPAARARARTHALGLLLAGCAAVWHAALLSKATNDNFFHMTLAKEWLAGEWPVRDFFDSGWVLHYTLSAVAQAVGGDRLASEAVLVGTMWAVSTYIVFRLVSRLTGSTAAAALCAVLLIVAGPRGYAYPKGIVYAGAAALWWRYVERPTAARAVPLGAWAAAAFYWRPDHGVYVAIGVLLATLVAHGLRPVMVSRTSVAAATAVVLVAPFMAYVHLVVGLPEYVRTGYTQGLAEHTTHATHAVPLLRYSDRLVAVMPSSDYAPEIAIRWSATSSAASRAEILARYGLTHAGSLDARVDRVRLSDQALREMRALLNEPLVEDTAGVDRSTATLLPEAWSAWQRWSFRYPLLRTRVLPSLEPHERASEFLVALWFLLPAGVALLSPWLRKHLPEPVTGPRLATFALFAVVVDFGLLRTPYTARAVDAVVIPSVLFGCVLAASWRAGAGSFLRRGLLRACAVAVAVLVYVSLAGAAEFGERASWLSGQWGSFARATSAWQEVHSRLTASPPLAFSLDRPAGSSMRLAAYVRACVPPSERLLVLWFAPDIHYFADRRMAHRHLVFPPEWRTLEHEQRMSVAKVTRFAPPLVLARRSSIQSQARAAYPSVVEYVEHHYEVAAAVADDGEEYLILARRDRTPVRRFGVERWPCFTTEPSKWERVGQVSD